MSVELNDNFLDVMREFIPDFLSEFPSYETILHPGINAIVQYKDNTFPESVIEDVLNVYNYSKTHLPRHFVDIINDDTSFLLSENPNVTSELIIGIDFKTIWIDKSTSNNTKSIIMNYLKMFLLSLLSDIEDKCMFGDKDIFENMASSEFQDRMHTMIEDLEGYFKDKDKTPNIPKPEKIEEQMNTILNGTIGKMAKEIAEETLQDITTDISLNKNNPELLKHILNDPSKIMNLTSKIGKKLDAKIKNGDIKDNELMQEASNIMETMTNIPGMEIMQDMVFKMFNSDHVKKNKMHQDMKTASTKERMLQKLKQRQADKASNNEHKFRSENSEPMQKSARPKKKNINKKKKNK